MNAPHPLLSKFERSLVLTEVERQAISALPVQEETVRADQSILREGDRPKRSCLLVEGVACNAKVTLGGKRQILAFHLPEDMPDLTSLHLELRDSDTWALTDCTLAFVDHRDLDRFCDEQRRLAKFLWRSTLIDASVHREWTVNVGAREGLNRVAHLFCEMLVRLRAVGLAEDNACDLPITQGELADAFGLTAVHVNRIVQQMRAEGLIVIKGSRLTIPDWDRLKEAGEFTPRYLHLERGQAAA